MRAPSRSDLACLPSVRQALPDEILALIERERLLGLGCGWVELTLLASILLTPGARLWALGARLKQQAQRLGCAYVPPVH